MIGAAVTSGIGALFNLGAAIRQGRQAKEAGRKAKEMEEKGWNKYHTPEAFNRSLAMSENQYLSPNMLGQSLLEDKLGASTANQVSRINRTAGSGAEALLGLGMAQNNYNNQLNNIAMQSAQQRYADFNGFMNMLGKKGDYQDKEWEINKWTPYQNTLDEKRALETSSRANWQNFGKAIGDAGVTGYMMKNMAGGQGGDESISFKDRQKMKRIGKLWQSQGN